MAIVYRFYRPGGMLSDPVYTTNEKEAAMAAMQGYPVSMISGDWFPMKATWNLAVDHSRIIKATINPMELDPYGTGGK